jgi:hypothetical protein
MAQRVRRNLLIALPLIVLFVLGLAQLLLPDIAARRLRDQLSGSGRVLWVHVDAFPAIELLWHRADRVEVQMESYRAGARTLSDLLAEASDVGRLTVTTTKLDSGLITLRDASLVKAGDRLSGSATMTEADLRRAVPVLENVTPVASAGGALVLRGTATLLGASLTADAVLAARNGSLVLTPNLPFGGLASITVFADPRLFVQKLSAAAIPGGFRAAVVASLH